MHALKGVFGDEPAVLFLGDGKFKAPILHTPVEDRKSDANRHGPTSVRPR